MCFRQSRNKEQGTFWMSNTLVGKDALSSLDTCSVFPLYLYPDDRGQQTIDGQTERRPNLNEYIVSKIAAGLDLRFEPEKTDEPGTLAPLDILDYIYAVLHSPAYREKYQEFLKIDFPRVPYPADPERFWQLVKLGGELRGLHLLESPAVMQFITTYPVTGANAVTRRMLSGDFELTGADRGRVWINDTQYFDGVPVVAWNFYIGGYQPAQKWLKDRKGRQLSFDDIMHYQKVIVALTETARVVREIDGVLVV
jgi:predicted helicase